ncbi:MAG: serine/threonine protein kinase [Myxococcales bacterium]|nr:serine/threonine protein kinase [Myxococcales bacterium]
MNDRRKSPHVGDLVGGKYQLLKKIGEGGHGRVYRAINVLLDREVAIKVLKPEFVADEASKKRFFREAKTANRVRHPNVVDVLDVGDSEEGPWMVQELLVGEPLSAMLVRERALPVDKAIELLLPALSALAVAHSKGIAHRDFKPENVFLVRGEGGVPTAKVLDFGLSKSTVRFGAVRESDNITATGAIIGTPAYLSPERARTESNGDVRGDVWAVGVVLYECTTGALPFVATNVRDMFVRICRGDVIPIEEVLPDIDPTFAAIVMRCLEYQPEDRFASAAELVEELRRFVEQDDSSGARSEPPPPQANVPPIEPPPDEPEIDHATATSDEPPALEQPSNALYETPLSGESSARASQSPLPTTTARSDREDARRTAERASTNANRSLTVLLAIAVIALVVQWRANRSTDNARSTAGPGATPAAVDAALSRATADAGSTNEDARRGAEP